MRGLPVVLGINRTQDASICLLKNGRISFAIQKERLTRVKHDWGKPGDFRNVYKKIQELHCPIDFVVECYSSDAEFLNRNSYCDELRTELKISSKTPILAISHHLAHLYSAFPLSGFSDSSVLVCDFMGSPASQIVEKWPPQDKVQDHWVEVTSCYCASHEKITCISKQMWNRDRTQPVGLGGFYYFLTQQLFPGEGNEGKVMGLAPYGTVHKGMSPLNVKDGCVVVPGDWLEVFRVRQTPFSETCREFQKAADLAATGQSAFEAALARLCEWLRNVSGQKRLCYAGGTALNCVANSAILRNPGFKQIYIPPAPHDGGTAIGCAVYGLQKATGASAQITWETDFLGPCPSETPFPDLFDTNECSVDCPPDLSDRCGEVLAAGAIVALYQGRGELGPRALGHRSILADPRQDEIRAYINQFIKGRELFRPLAPVVLEEDAESFFDLDRPSPFMQFTAVVCPCRRAEIPAVTHVDGTARVQTLTKGQDPFLYDVLRAFRKRTGLGVLLNTSLNGRGEPIVETPAEAVDFFLNSRIEILIMPPFMARKHSSFRPTLGLRTETTFVPYAKSS
jgi:carbamoyltransferase